MESCPSCGSTDLVNNEIGDKPEECRYECEACGEDFTGDEINGGEWE